MVVKNSQIYVVQIRRKCICELKNYVYPCSKGGEDGENYVLLYQNLIRKYDDDE